MSRRPARVVRQAERADGPRLAQLFASVTMDADVRVAVERDPDFFALYDVQEEAAQRVYVVEVDGRLEGLAACLGRDGWIGGARARVAYAGDLRLSPRVRGGFFLGRVFGPCLEECLEDFGAEVAYTAIFASNQAALRALVHRSPRLPRKPVYRPWVDFDILNIHFTRRRRPRPTDLTVRRAREEDLGAVAALLAADHRRRPFGYVVDEDLLRRRIARWPDLGVESFYLALRGPRLVGVTAPWDAHALKRTRVLEYRGSMRWVRAAFNLGAFLLRYPPLPPPGHALRFATLTHTSVEDEDPAVMAALVDRVYADLHGTGVHFLSVLRLRDDPLAPAYARYMATPLPAKLFTVSPPGSPWNDRDPGPGRPGFEMALV